MAVVVNKPVTCAELRNRFPQFFIDSIGDLQRTITRVGDPDSADPDSAIFMATPKALKKGLTTNASVWVVGPAARSSVEPLRGERTVLISTNVELAMASVINEFFLKTPYTNPAITEIHSKATIDASAQIASGVRIGPGAYIGAGVKVEAGVFIGANSVIEDETVIGEGTVIHPLVYIGHSTVIGKRCEIHPHAVIGKEGFGYAHDEKFNHYRIPHCGRVVIEDDVHIGAGMTVDRATITETRIERGAKFDNQVHLAHNTRIGRNSLLTAGFAAAGSSKVGANFVAGGKSVVTGHIEVCDNVQLAALSAVGKEITRPGQYGGVPLQPLQQFLKMKAAMVHLPEMRRQIGKILRKLGLDEEE